MGVYERSADGTSADPVEPEHELPETEVQALLGRFSGVTSGSNVLIVTDSKKVFATLGRDEQPARLDAVLRENVVDLRGMAVMMAQEVSADRARPWVDVTYLRPAVL